MKHYDFIIIGAGNSGRTAVETLVSESPGPSILLLDSEAALPYKRTKISKNIHKGYGLDDFAIHQDEWYARNGIDLMTGVSVISIDPAAHSITLASGVITYAKLLLATGALSRNPFYNLPAESCASLWTVHDGLALRESLAGLNKVAIVGVGVLGIEASWQTSLMGLETILVGRAERPMSKYLDSVSSDILKTSAEDSDVRLLLEHDVTGINRSPRGNGVLLDTDKGQIEADFVLITAGSRPDISLAAGSGLQVRRGILVDPELRTSAPDIWAAGDCAEHPDGTVTGLWHSAEHQGKLAAMGMLGKAVRNLNPPYRLKCEVFGGFWFSAGPVNSIDATLDPAETWEFEGIIWRPRFRKGKLAALSAVAVSGMDKALTKTAQNLVLSGGSRDESLLALAAVQD